MVLIAQILFLFSALNSAIYFTYLWQLKEYRLDRMSESLSYASGWKRLFPFFYQAKIFILMTGVLYFLISQNSFVLVVEGVLALGFELVEAGYRLFKHHYFRPERTAKALLVVVLSFVVEVAGAFALGLTDSAWNLALFSLLSLPIVTLIVALFWPITNLVKQKSIRAGTKKIDEMPNLKVIGITGSYGKSSTKMFLDQILTTKFKVLKTPGNTNVDIGVARVILNDLKIEHEVFIVEMGAYKMGEIRKIGKMVKPQIAIVTAVENQHLALFGSLENLKKAKYELIESLRDGGVAIFNQDSEGAMVLAKKAQEEKKMKVLKYSSLSSADIQAQNIVIEMESLSFEVLGTLFKAPLIGKHHIPNLLASIAVALQLGMKLNEIAAVFPQLKAPAKTMELKKNLSLSVIDDSYNSNPDGTIAALHHLLTFRDCKKIMVFPGMLELGSASYAEHVRVGQEIAKICDEVIFTAEDFLKPLQEGMGEHFGGGVRIIIKDQDEIFQALNSMIQTQHAVILFESRGAELAMKKLLDTSTQNHE